MRVSGPIHTEPVRGLRRCARCGDLTRDGLRAFHEETGEPVYFCPKAACCTGTEAPPERIRPGDARFRFREYAIEPDREPDAEAIGFAGECAVCEERGPAGGSVEDGEGVIAWMLGHLRRHPEHLSYREIVTRPYRAVPGEWR
ncbi:DUF7848 domain-containing protein [Streptomyces alkaliphilus]|uniref:DUF7848 domain-containing protein n=1 Tax=Streptomyces alkaliphilus TaxID=1472722 RepID=UPI002B1F3FA0|nr:hypothetical protein [Streptomyces alkaliphilus]